MLNYVCFSLLDILADRRGKSMISGTVLIGGRSRPPNFKCLVGYVVQVSLNECGVSLIEEPLTSVRLSCRRQPKGNKEVANK